MYRNNCGYELGVNFWGIYLVNIRFQTETKHLLSLMIKSFVTKYLKGWKGAKRFLIYKGGFFQQSHANSIYIFETWKEHSPWQSSCLVWTLTSEPFLFFGNLPSLIYSRFISANHLNFWYPLSILFSTTISQNDAWAMRTDIGKSWKVRTFEVRLERWWLDWIINLVPIPRIGLVNKLDTLSKGNFLFQLSSNSLHRKEGT